MTLTLVLLGRKIDKELVDSFLSTPEVTQCFPPNWDLSGGYSCQCYPQINIKSARNSFADRIVLFGDSATSKLYKNGLGAAYMTSKAAAATAVLHGVSRDDFRKHYLPICRSISRDNTIGEIIFMFTRLLQKINFAKRGIIRMVVKEQKKENKNKPMSHVLWDTFTGSAPYRSIFKRTRRPGFIFSLVSEMLLGIIHTKNKETYVNKKNRGTSDLGTYYKNGDIIVKEGDIGTCMYVIQSGTVEVTRNKRNRDVFLAERLNY